MAKAQLIAALAKAQFARTQADYDARVVLNTAEDVEAFCKQRQLDFLRITSELDELTGENFANFGLFFADVTANYVATVKNLERANG